MFTPTKQQLEELGFEKDKDTWCFNITEEDFIIYGRDEIFILTIGFGIKNINPESIEDLQALIRMLTPPNN